MSKGSTQRPAQVNRDTYEANWDAIFGHNRRLKDDGRRSSTIDKDRDRRPDGSGGVSNNQ